VTLSPQFLDEIRARTSLSALIGRSVKLVKAGREYKACCPFHSEKTPSFYVNDDKGFYHCFGCQAHSPAQGAPRHRARHVESKRTGEGAAPSLTRLPFTNYLRMLTNRQNSSGQFALRVLHLCL